MQKRTERAPMNIVENKGCLKPTTVNLEEVCPCHS